ncbi:hypothetical protein CASFOL_020706 [Castilleja foliolosa]|uniref:F-box domain-containing protein n=1 Tax=Castilleja foliolosa TaxID=1961234 RepID=A0ABD3D4K2_9LAMI
MERVKKVLFANRSTLPTLPDDIIFYHIFPRLPVKSIHRFRCVSTSCRRLTSDRNFLAALRLHSGRYFLSFSTSMHWQLAPYSVNRSGAASAVPISGNHLTYAKIVNGLMLTVHGGYKTLVVSVSNTVTNERFLLPSFPEPSSMDMMHFYFCHEPETDRYKVLRTTAIGAYNDANPTIMKYSVFTLGAHATWKDYTLLQLYQTGNSRSVCINGTLYCTRFSWNNSVDGHISVIGAFTVKRKCFYAVKYPDGLPSSRYNHCHLIEMNGALAIADVDRDFDCRAMKVWIKEKGKFRFGEETWTEHRIEFDPRWEAIYGLPLSYSFSTSLDGEIMMGSTRMRSGHGCWIFVYDMERREWRIVEIEGLGDRMILGNFSIDEYVESPFLLRQILYPSSHQLVSKIV